MRTNGWLSMGIGLYFLIGQSQLYSQNVPDVGGFALGMTLDQAKTQLGSSYKLSIPKFPDPTISEIVATRPTDGWVVQAVSGRVVYIQHSQIFKDEATRPLASATNNRLLEKYGTAFNLLAWIYDASGKSVKVTDVDKANEMRFCLGYLHGQQVMQMVPPGDVPREFAGMVSSGDYRPNCPRIAEARITTDVHDSRVAVALDVREADSPALYKEAATWAKLQKDKQQRETQQRDSKRQQAPL